MSDKNTKHHELSARDTEALLDVYAFRTTTTSGWGAPMMAGAWDASHHSATMAKLARWGLLERRERGGGPRRVAWEYRCSKPGAQLAARVLLKRRAAKGR